MAVGVIFRYYFNKLSLAMRGFFITVGRQQRMGIESWSTTAANNNAAAPNGAPEGMAPAGVNDVIRQNMASIRAQCEDGIWFNWGDTPTYVSSTSFTISGDVTARYQAGRRLKLYGTTMGTIYASVVSSSYSAPNTTITLAFGTITNNISQVKISLIESTNSPLILPSAYRALVYKSSSQSLSTGSAAYVSFDTELYDVGGFHDNVTNNSRLTIPSGVNYVKVTGFLTFGANNTGDRVGVIHKNGSPSYMGHGSYSVPAAVSSGTDFLVSTGIIPVSSGDYFQLSAYQDSGSSISLGATNGCFFAIEVIS